MQRDEGSGEERRCQSLWLAQSLLFIFIHCALALRAPRLVWCVHACDCYCEP